MQFLPDIRFVLPDTHMHYRPATPQEIGDGEDRLMDPHSPEVPPAVRTTVLAMAQPGDQL